MQDPELAQDPELDGARARLGPPFDGGAATRRAEPRIAGGDVAQLGEHRVRIAGVRGSSPLISTTSSPNGPPLTFVPLPAFGCRPETA